MEADILLLVKDWELVSAPFYLTLIPILTCILRSPN
jgi:hypothetical protein